MKAWKLAKGHPICQPCILQDWVGEGEGVKKSRLDIPRSKERVGINWFLGLIHLNQSSRRSAAHAIGSGFGLGWVGGVLHVPKDKESERGMVPASASACVVRLKSSPGSERGMLIGCRRAYQQQSWSPCVTGLASAIPRRRETTTPR